MGNKCIQKLKEPRILQWGTCTVSASAASAGGGGSGAASAALDIGASIVELELDMRDGRSVRAECQPIHAAILEVFAEPPSETDAAAAAASSSSVAANERTRSAPGAAGGYCNS